MGAKSGHDGLGQKKWPKTFEIIEEFFVVSLVQRFKSADPCQRA